MKPLHRFAILCIHAGCLGLLAIPATAQTTKYAVTPAGSEFHPGNYNNTYPFAGISARYQQIHDAVDMGRLNGGGALIMTAIGFRPAAAYSIVTRTWDVQFTLSPTTVNAAAMSTTFSRNATTTPTVVLPYTKFNTPAGKGVGTAVPNKILWNFPFKQLFIYTPGPGKNLLWEWQSKNGNAYALTFMDACNKPPVTASARAANLGNGCTATGKSSPAKAQALISSTNASLSLVNAPATAQALLWIGIRRTAVTGPGWCSSLFVNPLVVVAGTTDSTGTWKAASVPAASLNTKPYWEAFSQFGFADKGLVGGFGLSDMAAFAGPGHYGTYLSRVWSLASANGGENAATGSAGPNTGLVTLFTIK